MSGVERPQKARHALITGGAGFIGSHLSEALLERGYRVTVIDDLSTGAFDNIAHLTDNLNFAFALDTIANEVVLDRLASECSVIFHLAAAVGVKLIVENLIGSIETNIMGSEAVLKAGARYRVKVLLASSSEVYGKGNSIPFREDDDVVIGPTTRSRWAYAAAKMVDEFLALAYHREKGLPVVIFRLFNTVGPRQTGQYGMVIPRLVEQALKGDPLTVYGDGRQSRCFMHVADAVAALIALAECPEADGKVFNVGSTENVTVLDLAHRVLEAVDRERRPQSEGSLTSLREPARLAPDGDTARIVLIPYEEAYVAGFEDMPRRVPDISRVQQYTGWAPTYSLDATLQSVIATFMADTTRVA